MRRLFLLIILISAGIQAQEIEDGYSFSLEEAIRFGLENNYSSVNAQRDIDIAIKQKWEIIAQGLPQLSATTDYQNY